MLINAHEIAEGIVRTWDLEPTDVITAPADGRFEVVMDSRRFRIDALEVPDDFIESLADFAAYREAEQLKQLKGMVRDYFTALHDSQREVFGDDVDEAMRALEDSSDGSRRLAELRKALEQAVKA